MSYPYFDGKNKKVEINLPSSKQKTKTNPEHYTVDEDKNLIDAINVALLTQQPLFLTGEPGTGKTQLAYRIAWELNLHGPLKFETRSTSLATDLFYQYDSLGFFHASHRSEGSSRAADYIHYNALGLAILKTLPLKEIKPYVNSDFKSEEPARSVVLIDEIDKAPRDFPNDILNQLEDMYFRIPELDNKKIAANPDLSPIVIITSNSEKHLPDAFLRRCVFHHIDFPDKGKLIKIAEARLKDLAGTSNLDSDMLENAIDLFLYIRNSRDLRKKPATAELLIWLDALSSGVSKKPFKDMDQLKRTMGTLIKSIEDVEIANSLIDEWNKKRS